MERKKLSLGLLLIAVFLLPTLTYASIITEGGAYPLNGMSLGTPDNDQYIMVGYYGNNGSLLVDTNVVGSNSDSHAYGDSLSIGWGEYSLSTGTVTVEGNGSEGSASLILSNDIRTGNGGTGTLNIQSGGLVQSNGGFVVLGTDGLANTPGSVVTNINGQGSVLRAQQSSEGETWERYGGIIGVGYFGKSNSVVNITNGGVMEALSGGVGDTGDNGRIFIAGSSDGDNSGTTAIVNVDGLGSAVRADNYMWVGSEVSNVTAQLNITNGASVEILDGYAGDGEPSDIDMNVSAFPVNSEASVTISGYDPDTLNSSMLSVDQLQIGGTTSVAGYRSDGTPVGFRETDVTIFGGDTDFQVGDHITDRNGNPIYDKDGNPVLAVNQEIFPGFFAVVPSTKLDENRIYVKDSGSVVVENDALLQAQTINISKNEPNATTYNGQGASLTLDNAWVIGDVNVYEDGTLNGNGLIDGSVTVNGGTVSPGFSPGDIAILGDLTVETGILKIEVESESVYDNFWVSGDIYFGDDAQINLIFSYEEQGIIDLEQFFSEYNSLAFGDGFDPITNIALEVIGMDDYSIDLSFFDRTYTYTANGPSLNDDVGGPVPEPTTMLLFSFGLLGIAGVNRRRKN